MSNPYGSDQPADPSGTPPPLPPSGGQDPYGTQPPPFPPAGGTGQPPYGGGQPPYGGGGQPPYGGPQPPFGGGEQRKTDAVSIVGFVLSLTCCLSVVGAVLGFVGLRRTKDGQRKGRWAAISAAIIGVLGTLAFAAIIVAVVFFAKHVVTPENATAGQCANVTSDSSSDQSDQGVLLTKKDCSESHDAEVVYVGTAGSDAAQLNGSDATAFQSICEQRASSTYSAVFGEDYQITVFVDSNDISASDKFLCYAEPSDGHKLTAPIEQTG